jgi:ankyrin repeat protein
VADARVVQRARPTLQVPRMPQDTDLHKCAKDGDTAGIMDLLQQGAAVNAQGAQGRTALHRALGGGFHECSAVLLDGDADAAMVDAMKRTSLHWAALGPDPNDALTCIKLLFDRCGDAAAAQVNMTSKSGSTPLHCVAESGRAEICRFLHERGADPNVEDGDGKTAIVLAKAAGLPKDLFNAGGGRRGSTAGAKKGGLFSKLRRASRVGDPEVAL